MRYTAEKDPDLRTIPASEIWVGIIPEPRPYIVIASRLDGDDAPPVAVVRFGSAEARGMAAELIRLAATIEAPNN
jgi:hypothetical protein